MSQQVQGRVFDSSLYAFIADVAVSLSSSGYATASYVDGSLAERDSSIEFLAEYEVIQDTSINVLETAITNIDTSINDIWVNQINQDSSISNLYTTKLTKTSTDYVSDVVTSLGTGQRLYDYKIDGPNGIYVVLKEVFNGGGIILTDASGAFSIKVNDASFTLKTLFDSSISYLVLRENITDTSLNTLKLRVDNHDTSLASLNTWEVIQDSSIVSLRNRLNTTDTSLNTLKLRVDNHDTSILLLNNWNISQDSSISTLRTKLNTTDTSLNTLKLRVDNHDTSINLINNWNIEQDVSIAWCAANISGFPDASVNEIYSYVDGSLNLKVNKTLFDSSIASLTGWNLSQDASLILKANKSDVDSSLGNYYNKTQIDASLGVIYTKTQVDSSFGLITNLAKSPFQILTLANAADSSIAWSIRNGWNAKYTLTKDVSLMIPDVSHGDSGTLLLIEDASGTWKMNLPSNSFILSDASTITKTAGAKNFLTFVYDISTFYWNLGKNYIAQSQV